MVLCPLILLALTLAIFGHTPPISDSNLSSCSDSYCGNPAFEKDVITITPPPLPDQTSDAIKFIGAGHGHTGTQSLWYALKILGYHPAHGELFDGYCGTTPNMTLKHIWTGPTTSQNEDVRLATLLERSYNATTPDTPLDKFWLTLKHRYPDAPVVLTLHAKGTEGFVKSMLGRRSWNGNEYDISPQAIARKYEAENEEIRQTCLNNNWTLLEFKATDGWEPLCKYLSVPVPTSPYPHVNAYASVNAHGEGCDPMAGIPYLS